MNTLALPANESVLFCRLFHVFRFLSRLCANQGGGPKELKSDPVARQGQSRIYISSAPRKEARMVSRKKERSAAASKVTDGGVPEQQLAGEVENHPVEESDDLELDSDEEV